MAGRRLLPWFGATRIRCVSTVLAAGLIASALASPLPAATFKNSFIAFDLPEGWTCSLHETVWVCDPPRQAGEPKSMLVIFGAKEVGYMDSPQSYMREVENKALAPGVRFVQRPAYRLIRRLLWLDASLANSEVPGYVTRYLARTEGDLGVLVTFSYHPSVSVEAKTVSDALAGSVTVNPVLANRILRERARRDD